MKLIILDNDKNILDGGRIPISNDYNLFRFKKCVDSPFVEGFNLSIIKL